MATYTCHHKHVLSPVNTLLRYTTHYIWNKASHSSYIRNTANLFLKTLVYTQAFKYEQEWLKKVCCNCQLTTMSPLQGVKTKQARPLQPPLPTSMMTHSSSAQRLWAVSKHTQYLYPCKTPVAMGYYGYTPLGASARLDSNGPIRPSHIWIVLRSRAPSAALGIVQYSGAIVQCSRAG